MSTDFYEERYCAFLDVLGFSNCVTSAFSVASEAEREEGISRLVGLNEQIGEELRAMSEECQKISFSHFSDSIFLSVPVTEEDGIGQLFYRIQRLCTALLIRGFLTRGGVVCGLVHSGNDVVFGPGLIEAYRLESRVARHPRIVVAKSVRDRLTSDSDASQKLIWPTDGPPHINCLQLFEDLAQNVVRRGFPEVFSEEKYKRRFEFLKTICNLINRELSNTRDEPDVFTKVRWLADQLNARVISKGDPTFPGWPGLISDHSDVS